MTAVIQLATDFNGAGMVDGDIFKWDAATKTFKRTTSLNSGMGLVAPVISGAVSITPQILTAAGATQGTATAITGFKAVVTVALTVSTKGVKLPAAATGLEVEVVNGATFGFKVYPAAGNKIGAAATNAADTTLAINKANRYIAVNTLLWVVQRGA